MNGANLATCEFEGSNKLLKALIVGHRLDPSVPSTEVFLESFGFDVEFIDRLELTGSSEARGFDLLVSLGSDWRLSSDENDAQTARSIKCESQLIESAIECAVPFLGICFGAQLLASVSGGEVRTATVFEIGWKSISSTSHPELFDRKWMEWHYDSIVPPVNADVIASNSAGVQAFRLETSLGLQFHPEADFRVISGWLNSGGAHEVAGFGISSEALLAETQRLEDDAKCAFRAVFRWFLDSLRSIDPDCQRS